MLHIRYDSTYPFMLHPRGHLSRCHLKVIQAGEAPHPFYSNGERAIVILTKDYSNTGTGIANAACHLATEITDRFRLHPANTIYIEHTPPEENRWPFFIMPGEADDEEGLLTLERKLSSLFGPGEEKYEQIFFKRWFESPDYNEPRYQAHDPYWMPITPLEFARQVQELELSEA
jgi:hypothetical protein